MKTQQKTSEILSQRLATEQAITLVKSTFENDLKEKLGLHKISAPMIVLKGEGINDDLSGTERAVEFPLKGMAERRAEVVQSLAKWKRIQLKTYDFRSGTGILTDMKALRADEEFTSIHSVFVDQWDWELAIDPDQRNLCFLKETVRKIYSAIVATERSVAENFPEKYAILPDEIKFIHAEVLLKMFPGLSAKEREHSAAREFGAVFIIGIGGVLSSGESHDQRAPDYDDWSSPGEEGYFGLNGDIILWNPVLEQAFEISSMGIRVDADSLEKQLEITGQQSRKELLYHRTLLAGQLGDSIGGGIGQSRLCMFLLKKQHIGEVQVSIWPEHVIGNCRSNGITLL
ncbi:MAG TPA: aspartate--ammonia ligase [Salinimicrobium sp.]|nr:aspartate--ammonia ligase [Salinimicrobium sp.]